MQKKGITAKEHIIISLYVREKDPHEEACSKATWHKAEAENVSEQRHKCGWWHSSTHQTIPVKKNKQEKHTETYGYILPDIDDTLDILLKTLLQKVWVAHSSTSTGEPTLWKRPLPQSRSNDISRIPTGTYVYTSTTKFTAKIIHKNSRSAAGITSISITSYIVTTAVHTKLW